jgi:Ala-tRNA(Pro) deacylase
MIPDPIVRYLRDHHISFTRHWHPRAVGAQSVAQALHVSGSRLAKTVICDVDGKRSLVVIPANLKLDEQKLSDAMNAKTVRLVPEVLFEKQFPACEAGAEPPFGALYGMPVILDASFRNDSRLILRAGSHEETVEISYADFVRLENPTIVSVGLPIPAAKLREGPPLQM